MNNTTHSSDTAHNQQDTTQQTRHRCDAVIKTPDSIVHFPVAWVNGDDFEPIVVVNRPLRSTSVKSTMNR